MTTHNHVARAKDMAVRAGHRAHGMFDERIAGLREEAKVRSQALLETVKDRGGDLLDEAQDRGQKLWGVSKDWIGENPGAAIGIAFVAGVIVRSWFSGSRDDD